MHQISELKMILFHYLDWNKARVKCLLQLIQGIFLVRTVNLTQIAQVFQTPAKPDSSYRRIQRFFLGFSFDMTLVIVLILRLFTFGEKCALIMDRTNWKWGRHPINILMLSVEHFGMSIPLFWIVLKTGGSSATKDRMQMMRRVLKTFGLDRIQVLLADREFIGEEWFRFLIDSGVPFVIRVKQNSMVSGLRNDSTLVPIKEVVKLMGRRKELLNQRITLWNQKLLASVEWKSGAKEPMIVVSNREFPNPLKLYRWRWSIETMFECMKSRGFRLEDTHMIHPKKIEKLLFILAIAVCWAHKTGELQERRITRSMQSHGRKSKSIFRIGLDLLRRTLLFDDIIVQELSLLSYFSDWQGVLL